MSRIYLAYRSKKQRFCAVQAFCAAKPWRRANSLRPSISISCRNPKKEVTTYVVTSFFGAGDEARTRYLHLGKVALYQMSYARKWCLRSELNQRHADFQSAALPTELQRHIEARSLSPQYIMATRNRLELSTSSVTGWRANRLHHRAR